MQSQKPHRSKLPLISGVRPRIEATRMILIDTVWARIKALEGETFHQIRGKPFIYSILGSALVPEGINQNIARTDFEKALQLLPLESTAPVQHLRGPSYIYAVLMDKRVRRDDEWGSKMSGRGDR